MGNGKLAHSEVRIRISTALLGFAALVSYSVHAENFELLSPLSSDTIVRGGNLPSFVPAISADGTVVVYESATDTSEPGNASGLHDVYVYDATVGSLVNLTLGGNNHSGQPDVSGDGRYVAFKSAASNLHPDDANGDLPNHYLYDRELDLLEIITPNQNAGFFTRANTGISRRTVRISGDGSYVLFSSLASNLTGGINGSRGPLFLWERESDTFVDIMAGANSGSSFSDFDISDDGTWVVLSSRATNLTVDSVEGEDHLFVYNTVTESFRLLPGTESADQPTISGDGRYIAFQSRADGRPGAVQGLALRDVYLLDTMTGDRTLITPDADDESFAPGLNADGSQLVFRSEANNLLPNDNNGNWDIFVYTRDTGALRQITAGSDGINVNPAIDATGDNIAFASAATNLLDQPEDNGVLDMYIWRNQPLEPPECNLFPAGVFRSSSGVSISLAGATRCPTAELVSLGSVAFPGLNIPGTRTRPELNLVPDNEGEAFDDEFVFYRYPLSEGTAVYVASFVDRSTRRPVSMSFRTDDLRNFELFELAVFSNSNRFREQLVYVEHGTRWTFSSEEPTLLAQISGSVFDDVNDNGLKDDEEAVHPDFTSLTLFYCSDRDGVVENRLLRGSDNDFSFGPLAPGFYQLGVRLNDSFRFTFSDFDENGEQRQPIRAVNPPPNQMGFTNCTFYESGSSVTLDIGVKPRG